MNLPNQIQSAAPLRTSRATSRVSKDVSPPVFDRRELLLKGGAGFGGVVLSDLLGGEGLLAAAGDKPRGANHLARAKSVIFVFLEEIGRASCRERV